MVEVRTTAAQLQMQELPMRQNRSSKLRAGVTVQRGGNASLPTDIVESRVADRPKARSICGF
jgi:hypothetical protein